MPAWVNELLGLGVEATALTPGQSAARAVVVFIVGLALVRLGNKRFLGKNTALDVLVAIMLGTILARAINGSARLGSTFAGAASLVGLHYVLSAIAYRVPLFDHWLKGSARVLLKDGEPNVKTLRQTHINHKDLEEILRLQGGPSEEKDVALAILERSGDVSIKKRESPPRLLEVKVEDGVQTIRIRLDG
jgi:uncharacterized membrane protein YcaP (DUF421 family)